MIHWEKLACRLTCLLFFLLITSPVYSKTNWSRIVSSDFRKQPGLYMADETAGFVHKPKTGEAKGRFNNYGFVEQSPTEEFKKLGSLRILVTGDSHIDGIVGAEATFPNVLEVMLTQKDPGRFYEVINGGVGFYTFTNYAGFLEKFLFLKPDIYVVVIYLGNDFVGVAEGLVASGEMDGTRPEEYRLALNVAARLNPGAVYQHLNQTFFFKRYPQAFKRVLEVSFEALDDIRLVASEHDIRVIFVFLPTKIMTEGLEASGGKAAATVLGLTHEDISVFDRKAKGALLGWMHTRNAEYLDLTEALGHDRRELFAKHDHHLNDAGHQVLAEEFYARFGEDILSSRKVQ